MDLVYERENLNPEDVHMSLRWVQSLLFGCKFMLLRINLI